MEVIQFFINLFENQNILLKIVFMILISLYGLFALILVFQIRNLNKIVNQITFSPIFTLAALIHLGITVALLLFTVVFL